MRFSSAVDSLAKENQFLRTTVMVLILTVMVLSIVVVFLHDKEPVLVERSSRGLEVVRSTGLTRTEEDVDLALRLMLKARFDSEAIAPEVFLSKRQMELRQAESREMKARGLIQSVVFRKGSVSKDEATIEFDRVFAVGEVRSALKTVVRVAFEETEPTELNPYGLRLIEATPIEQKEAH